MSQTLAPRLAAAHQAFVLSERAWGTERARLIARRCELERLVAHRDLQVIRSEHRGAARRNARYMAWRVRKLARAQADLGEVVDQLAAHERIPPGHYDPT